MHLRLCIGTWSLCKAVPNTAESVCRRKFRLKAWREWLETYLQPELRLKFKDGYLSNVSCMPSTRPPTNESTRYLNDFPRFVKIVRGFKRKKKGDGTGSRHVGSRVLRESKCMVGREDREASKNNTSLVLNSYGLASAVFSATKRSINKAFFSFSHDVHTLHM